MTIVTTHYRPKRAPRKERKQRALAQVIVAPTAMKRKVGPVIRRGAFGLKGHS
jgi:hypothetical protein